MKWGTQQGSGLWGTVPTTCSAHGQKAISGLFQQVPSSETGHGERGQTSEHAEDGRAGARL